MYIAWDQWENWNVVLHDQRDDEGSLDNQFVNNKIARELSIAPSDLPIKITYFFNKSYEDQVATSLEYRRSWLQKIHFARLRADKKWDGHQYGERWCMYNWLMTGDGRRDPS